MKLGLYTAQLKDRDLTHFPLLNDACDGVLDMQQRELFVKTVNQMHEKFISRFSDFDKIKYAGHFIKEPFTFHVKKNQGLSCNFLFALLCAQRLTDGCSGKRTQPNHAAVILSCRNVAKHLRTKSLIIKFKSAFHIWINIHLPMPTFCSDTHEVTFPCASYRLQLTVTTLLCCYSFETNFTKLVSSREHQVSH